MEKKLCDHMLLALLKCLKLLGIKFRWMQLNVYRVELLAASHVVVAGRNKCVEPSQKVNSSPCLSSNFR